MTGSWKGLALAVLIGLIAGAGPLGALLLKEKAVSKDLAQKVQEKEAVITAAEAQVQASGKKAAELARDLGKAVAALNKIPRGIAAEVPGAKAVILDPGMPAPFRGALTDPARFSEMTQCLMDQKAWAIQKTQAEQAAEKAERQLAIAKLGARRIRGKFLTAAGGALASGYFILKKKPGAAFACLGGGYLIGEILF
jgi:hypothetical protein